MKLQAAVFRDAARPPELETLDIEEPRAGEILVRMVAAGICHTDLDVHHRDRSPKPIVLGHEGAGIVERVGPGVRRLSPGDGVLLTVNYCGVCPSCSHGAHSYCYETYARNFGGRRPDGSTPLSRDGQPINGHFFGQSSFATYALADERCAVRIPSDLPLEIMGPLACGVITGVGSVVNALAVRPGQSIAIFGAGAVGLSAVMGARLAGATRIVAVDVVPSRLELALELGATEVVEAGGAIRSVDCSLNTTRNPDVFTRALECLAPRGVAGFVGAPLGPWTPDMPKLLIGRSVRGILGGDAAPTLFIPTLLEYYRQGRLPFDRLIRFYPFADIQQAIHDCEGGTTVKAVLRMP